MKRFLKWFGLSAGLFAITLVVLGWWSDAPRPAGAPSAEADALARRVQAAVGHAHWAETGAIEWTFADRNTHLWDLSRGFARVRAGDTEVLLDLRKGPSGMATVDGTPVSGGALIDAVRGAYEKHINDRFWLHPFGTFFDAGTARALAKDDEGREGLLITYGQGGVTPGDAYLWFVDDDGRPTGWRMWVDILPIGGVRASWSSWQTLATGVQVATLHEGWADLRLSNVRAAPTLLALTGGTDPFAALAALREAPAPTSQPSP